MNERSGIRLEVAALMVAVTALAAYVLTLGNGFAYDDIPVVLGDSRLASLDLRAIFSGGYWPNPDLGLYRPLTTLSFALDWALAGNSPAWFHLVNVLWHAATCVLALLLLARLFPVRAALAGALVFALHPVHVEAIANVVGRSEPLAASFLLAACLVWMSDLRGRAALTSALFGLALLAKESAIMLPAALVLVDAARGRPFAEGVRPWVRRNLRAFFAIGVVGIGYLVLRAAVLGGLTPGRVDPTIELTGSAVARVLTALQAWPVFLRLLFFPLTLLADYGPRILLPIDSPNAGAVLGAFLLVATVLGGTVAFARGARRIGFGLLWFPVIVFPVSNFIIPIGVLVAERTLYLPSLAVAVAVAGVVVLVERTGEAPRRAFSMAGLIVLALLAGRVLVRIPDWQSTDAIMAALLRDRPDSFRGTLHGARVMRARRDAKAASAAYDRVLELWPYRREIVIEATEWATQVGDRERAGELAEWLVRQWPDDAAGYQILAGFALDRNDRAAARQVLAAGLRHAPADDLLRRMKASLDSLEATSP